MEYVCKNLDETGSCAEGFIDQLGDLSGTETKSGATVIGLRGELGAGKTTFTQAVARSLGIDVPVLSPTFVLQRIYKIPSPPTPLSGSTAKSGLSGSSGWKHLVHIDAYRLDSPEELNTIGWDDLVADPGNLILLEWPERVKDLLPEDTKYINFKHLDETSREVVW